MTVDVVYILIALGGLLVGFIGGWVVGRRHYELQRIKRVLRAKNPDLWDLEHFVAVDEQEERKSTGETTKKYRAVQ